MQLLPVILKTLQEKWYAQFWELQEASALP